jgi:hypothetical protein
MSIQNFPRHIFNKTKRTGRCFGMLQVGFDSRNFHYLIQFSKYQVDN